METEQLVLSFMELTNVPIDEARRYITAAGNILEVAIQNFYDAQGGEGGAEPADPNPYEEDEVRAPLPREYSQLVEEDSVRNVQLNRVKRQFASSFRDLKKETEIQEDLASGVAPKRSKCLEDIYRNPIDITSHLDLYAAKVVGEKQGKWIALLINDESFPSLCFNRDIFNTDIRQKVKMLIKKNFILLRKNASCEESLKIIQNYKLTDQSIPIFLILDSLTGELKKNFGDTKDLKLKTVVEELKKYTSSLDKELKYNSDVSEDSSDELLYPQFSGPSTAFTTNKPQALSKPTDDHSDSEESFASLHSDDLPTPDQSDDDETSVKPSSETKKK